MVPDALTPDFLTIGEQAARAGGAALLDWVGRFQAREKGPRDLVTEADLASQDAVHRVISAVFPQHDFVSEEGDGPVELGGNFCWVVDPLDGTTNYVHQIPQYAVSLALLERGRPVVGVVFDPVNRECFTAIKGKGAWLNGQPMRTSGVTELSQAVIAASFSARVDFPSPEIDQFVAAVRYTQGVRRTGSAALNLCYVACGRFDAFWALSTKAWDVAAGVLLVEEAGGAVTQLDGGAFSLEVPHPVATASAALQRQCCDMLNRATPVREAKYPPVVSRINPVAPMG